MSVYKRKYLRWLTKKEVETIKELLPNITILTDYSDVRMGDTKCIAFLGYDDVYDYLPLYKVDILSIQDFKGILTACDARYGFAYIVYFPHLVVAGTKEEMLKELQNTGW